MLIEFLARQTLDRECSLGHQRQFRRCERAQRMRRATRPANEADLQPAFAERAEMLEVETAADRAPSEVLRMHHDGLLISRRRILDLALVDVLPNRLVAVLALGTAVGRSAGEDAMIELAEIGKPLVAVVELPIAHEAIARRTAHLE